MSTMYIRHWWLTGTQVLSVMEVVNNIEFGAYHTMISQSPGGVVGCMGLGSNSTVSASAMLANEI